MLRFAAVSALVINTASTDSEATAEQAAVAKSAAASAIIYTLR